MDKGLDLVPTKGKAFGKPVHAFASSMMNMYPANERIFERNVEGSIPSSLLGSGGDIYFKILRQSAGLIRHCSLQIDATVASAEVSPTIAPLWIKKITAYTDNGADQAQEIYGEDILNSLGGIPSEKFRHIAELMHMNPDYSPRKALQVGTHRFHIPLYGLYLEGLFMRALNSDIQIEVEFDPILESGTASNITVSNSGVKLLVHEVELTKAQEHELYEKYRKNTIMKAYINHVRFKDSTTFTAGSTYSNVLNNIAGKVANLAIFLRSSTSNSSGGKRKFLKIGDRNNTGDIELFDGNKTTISGSRIDAEYALKHLNSKYSDGALYDRYNIYNLSWGDPFHATKYGSSKYAPFSFQNQIELTLASATAETARVITATPGGTAASGTWELLYVRGDGKSYSSGPLAYNASAATIQTAMNSDNLPDDLSIAIGGTLFSAGTGGMTITVSNLKEEDLAINGAQWHVISAMETSAPAFIEVSIANTTAGVVAKGFTTGTRTLDIDAHILRVAYINNGIIQVANA